MSRWDFGPEDFQKADKIGEGSFGSVYKGINMKTGETVAIKEIDLEITEEELSDIQNEISVLRRCASPYIISIYGSFVVDSKLWIVMEYAGVGSLEDLLKAGKIEEKYIAIILREILMGLDYLHSCDLIHRDLKSANVLINHHSEVKLGDFGVCGEISDTITRRHSFVGTPLYMSPEVIMQKEGYATSADIWSLGICAIELAQGFPPYSKISPQRVIFMIPKNQPPMLESSKYSKEFLDFVRLCLQKDASKRPTAEELLKHKFIRQAKRKKLLGYVISKYEEYKRTHVEEFNKYSSSGSSSDFDSDLEDTESDDDSLDIPVEEVLKDSNSSIVKRKSGSGSVKKGSSSKNSKGSKSIGAKKDRIFWDWDQEKVSVLPQNKINTNLLREMNESANFDIDRLRNVKRVNMGKEEDSSDDDDEEDSESVDEDGYSSDYERGYASNTLRRHSTPKGITFDDSGGPNILYHSSQSESESDSDDYSDDSDDDSDSFTENESEDDVNERIVALKNKIEREERLSKMDDGNEEIDIEKSVSPIRKVPVSPILRVKSIIKKQITEKIKQNENPSSSKSPGSSKVNVDTLIAVKFVIEDDYIKVKLVENLVGGRRSRKDTFSIPHNLLMDEIEVEVRKPIKPPKSSDSFMIFERIILPSIQKICGDGMAESKELINSFKRNEGEVEEFSMNFIKNMYKLVNQEEILRSKHLGELNSYGIFRNREEIEEINTSYLESHLKQSLSNVFLERWKVRMLKKD